MKIVGRREARRLVDRPKNAGGETQVRRQMALDKGQRGMNTAGKGVPIWAAVCDGWNFRQFSNGPLRTAILILLFYF